MLEHRRVGVEKIAGGLYGCSHVVDTRLQTVAREDAAGGRRYAPVGPLICESHAHDEVVFVAVTYAGVELVDEVVDGVGHVYVADIDQVPCAAACAEAVVPIVLPSGTCDYACEFGPFLVVE